MVWQPSRSNENFLKRHVYSSLDYQTVETVGPMKWEFSQECPAGKKKERLKPRASQRECSSMGKEMPHGAGNLSDHHAREAREPVMTMSRATSWPGLQSSVCSSFTLKPCRDPKNELRPLCSSSQSSHIE